jgi:S1-C subfamily serine protease
VITSINGQPVSSAGDVSQILATLKPGQAVRVGVTKSGRSNAILHVKLGQYPGTAS